MVVILGEQKLTLEEKVTKLEEEVAELEALQDMNDQLVESNAELELDLREELDMAHGATREVCFVDFLKINTFSYKIGYKCML